MHPYKIALVCDWFLPQIGGIELHLNNLAQELKAEGHEVHLFTTLPGPAWVNGIPVYRLPAFLLPGWNILLNQGPFKVLKQELKKGHFDVLHAHSGVVSPLAYGSIALAHQLELPCVLTNHSLLQTTPFFFRMAHFFSRWRNWPVILTSVSLAAAKGLRRASKRKQIPILPNGIHPENWNTEMIPKKEMRITSVMRLTRKKRPLQLIQMIAEVLKYLPKECPLKLSIIGDGPYRKRLEKKIRLLKIEKQVELLGYQPHAEIKKIFANSDFFVLPGKKESFGIVLLEARCAGLPVVAMNQGGVREIIRHGEQGFLANSSKEFVNYILKLVSDREMRLKMRRNSKKEIEQFSWPKIIAKHREVYQLAIEQAQKFYATRRFP